MADAPTAVVVNTQSAWLSKTNWTQVVGIVCTLLALGTMNKVSIPLEQQATIVGVIQGIQALATFVIKTWFTKTVTPSSVAQATVSVAPSTAVKIT